jgi:Tetraspanin family
VLQAAGLLMLAFGVAAAAKPESIVQLLSYTGELASTARNAGFDLAGILQNSSVFLIVMGVVVALVGLFGCIGACCNVKWMLSVVGSFSLSSDENSSIVSHIRICFSVYHAVVKLNRLS